MERDELRGKVFMEKVDGNHVINPESLPSTADAMALHACRVYLQLHTWMGRSLPPNAWGREVVDGKYFPILKTKPPSPDYLLKYIRCGCKEDSCKNKFCSCKKYGVNC